jgi:hypothetical protein
MQRLGNCAPDAAGSASDERCLACQVEHMIFLLQESQSDQLVSIEIQPPA